MNEISRSVYTQQMKLAKEKLMEGEKIFNEGIAVLKALTNITVVDDEYFNEDVRNNLPAWSDKLLPEGNDGYGMIHIINTHTLRGRIGHLSSQFGYRLQYKNLSEMIKTIRSKLFDGAKLTKEEEEVATYLEGRDEKSHFPRKMSEQQIFKAIRETYQDAYKNRGRQFPPDDSNLGDDFISERGRGRYEGRGAGILIEFYFDFDANVITTAYPKSNN